VIGAATLSLLGIAGTGSILATQGAFAQSSPTPTPSATAGTATSNEDAAHDAAETPEQEAAEDAGQAHIGRGGKHGSNEDAAYEAAETPEQEAAEDAAAASGNSATPATPSSCSTTQN